MGFFAPSFAPKRERWPGASSGLFGVSTRSGTHVTPAVAMTLPAVLAARRVLSETIGSLPCGLVEQVSDRQRRAATDDPLSILVGLSPCPGMDSMTWFDMQLGWQTDYGVAFAEKQYDLGGENAVALWPIHPSRVPPQNVVLADARMAAEVPDIREGEVVYLVRNDDGTCTPIPARDMLHVNGIAPGCKKTPAGVAYGMGVIEAMAESMGTAIAVERSAAAFFKNGMSSRFAISHPGKISPETAKELRRQWQEQYGGAENANKAVILEQGMDAKVLSINPDAAQLLDTRRFGISEVARAYRLPPHVVGDLARATWANIDAQQIDFVVYSLMPWLVRWEKALRLQLLPPERRARFQFKFNVNGLLRGDYAARSAFYKEMFNIGVFSQNDIRSLEDLNDIEGGDRYYVPTNNLTPIDRVDDMIDARMKAGAKPAEGVPAEADKAALREMMEGMIRKAEAGMSATEALAESFRLTQEWASAFERNMADRLDAIERRVAERNMEDGERSVSLVEASHEAEERIGRAAESVESRAGDLHVQRLILNQREREFSARQRKAVRATLQGALTGLVALEVRTVRQAAKDARSFAEAVDKFYSAKWPEVWSGALRPLSGMMEAAGLAADIDAERVAHEAESRRLLEGWDGVPKPNEALSGWVSERVELWSGRPAEAAARLVPERAEG